MTYKPKRLNIQWHLTEQCNLRCSHCYQESQKTPGLPHSELLRILDQCSELLNTWHGNVKGHLTITGGEPFLREDLFDLLEVISTQTQFSFSLLSNGTLLSNDMCKRLKKLGVTYVQVSVDGDRKMHDHIRGEGQFQKAIRGIKLLHKNKIQTLVSFTAHSENYKLFSKVASISRKLNVNRVWADRYIPHGNHDTLKTLTGQECKHFFDIMNRERIKSKLYPFSHTEVVMHRALQFTKSETTPYRCSAGGELITIGSQGELWPCRRMAIEVGNLSVSCLKTLYLDNKLFKRLRNPHEPIAGCKGCRYEQKCNGGLKCLSYAINGDPFSLDPGCSLNITGENE